MSKPEEDIEEGELSDDDEPTPAPQPQSHQPTTLIFEPELSSNQIVFETVSNTRQSDKKKKKIHKQPKDSKTYQRPRERSREKEVKNQKKDKNMRPSQEKEPVGPPPGPMPAVYQGYGPPVGYYHGPHGLPYYQPVVYPHGPSGNYGLAPGYQFPPHPFYGQYMNQYTNDPRHQPLPLPRPQPVQRYEEVRQEADRLDNRQMNRPDVRQFRMHHHQEPVNNLPYYTQHPDDIKDIKEDNKMSTIVTPTHPKIEQQPQTGKAYVSHKQQQGQRKNKMREEVKSSVRKHLKCFNPEEQLTILELTKRLVNCSQSAQSEGMAYQSSVDTIEQLGAQSQDKKISLHKILEAFRLQGIQARIKEKPLYTWAKKDSRFAKIAEKSAEISQNPIEALLI